MRKEKRVKEESGESLVHREKRDNHPTMSSLRDLRVLLVHQGLLGPWALLALKGPPEQGIREPTFRQLRL